MAKPISPNEIAEYKVRAFPEYVFDAFNELIAENFSEGRSQVYQNLVVERILEKANANYRIASDATELQKSDIFDRGYLNVEEVYRAQGWNVTYDKPGYNESYAASFLFKERPSR